MYDFVTNLSSNPICLLILLVILTCILNFSLKFFDPSEKNIKRIDYAWLAVAAVGLYFHAADVRIKTTDFEYEMQVKYTQNSLVKYKRLIENEFEMLECNEFFADEKETCHILYALIDLPQKDNFPKDIRIVNVVTWSTEFSHPS